jgi:hypothetical protein
MCLQIALRWKRSRHHVLPCKLCSSLDFAFKTSEHFNFACRLNKTHHGFLWDYQVWNKAYVSFGLFTEVFASLGSACLFDAVKMDTEKIALYSVNAPLPTALPQDYSFAFMMLSNKGSHVQANMMKASQQLLSPHSNPRQDDLCCFEGDFGHLATKMLQSTQSQSDTHCSKVSMCNMTMQPLCVGLCHA